jgi:AAA+ ATPase superfamily predicted ATPase
MFQTSTPVVGEGFHNREAELGALARSMERLSAGEPQWVAILGPRKIGKTSLVLEAARRVKSDSLRVVILDVQEQGPASVEIFRRLALRVADAAIGSEIGESIERLAGQASAYRQILQPSKLFGSLPTPLRIEVLELVEGVVTPERIGTWLDLPERLAAALGLWFVIALDEFQALEGLTAHRKGFNPFLLMRSRWQQHRRVAYFISGSARSMLLALVSSQQSPFFQHFSLRELGPFGHDAAIELLQSQSSPDRPIPAEVAQLAVKSLTGHPFYLQLLGEELTERAGRPDIAGFKAALQGLLFSRTGRLALFFENEFQRLVGRSTFLAATLNALAEGPATLTSVAVSIQAASGATVNYLERLQDAVIRTGDGRYQLTDPTFALWLRWRQPGGTAIPMSVVGDEAELAVARTLSDMGFELIYQSKASRGAFDLLATRGSMQLGVQVKRAALPARFKGTEWSRMVAEGHRFLWHWVVAAVGTDGVIRMLDPGKARRRREVSLYEDAEIPNLLRWLDLRKSADAKAVRSKDAK